MSAASATVRRSRPRLRVPSKYAPMLATLSLLVAMFTVGLDPLPGVRIRTGRPQRLHRQLVPARGGDRHDVRDPHRWDRPVRRLRRRAFHAHGCAAREARLADRRVDPRRARHRLGARVCDGLRHPLLRDPAVHRDARRHVPGARYLLRDHRPGRVDHAAHVCLHLRSTRSTCRAATTSRPGSSSRSSPSRSVSTSSTTRGSVATSTRSAAMPQSALLMGLPVARTQHRGLHDQRLLLGARRRAVLLLHAVRLREPRDRHGARRDRRGRDRRNAAHRRDWLPSGLGARRAACSGSSRR